MKRRWMSLWAAVVALPGIALAGQGFWSTSGPSGGQVYELLIDPASPNVLYASTRGEIIKSIDGGSSWSRAMNGLQSTFAFSFLMDRERPQRLYVVDTSGRLMRTIDGGANWAPTGYNPTASQISISAFADVPTAARNGEFYFIGFDFAASSPGIYRTINDGATFTRLPNLPAPPGRRYAAIAVSPTNPDLVLVSIDSYTIQPGDPPEPLIYRSTDAGANWTPALSVNSEMFEVFASARDLRFGAGDTVYVRASPGAQVRVSGDAGATWRDSVGFIGSNVNIGTVAPHPTVPGTLFMGTSAGIYVATDADTATPTVAGPSTTLSPNPSFTDGNVPPRTIQTSIVRLVVSPTFPAAGSALWALSEYAGLWRSTDGAASWIGGDSVNFGYSAVNVRAIEVHPHPAGSGVPAAQTRIYGGLGDANFASPALYRSNNSGGAWPVANTGLRAAQIRALVIDPTTTLNLADSVVYAAGRSPVAGFAPIPDAANSFLQRNGGLYKTINGGATWATIDATLPTRTVGGVTYSDIGLVRALALDPRSCSVGMPPGPTGPRCTALNGPLRTIFATASGFFTGPGAFTHRIVRSVDGGATWAASDAGLPATLTTPDQQQRITPVPIALDPSNSSVLYVGTFLSYGTNLDPPPPPTLPNGVFKSIDGGANWTLSSTGLPLFPGSTQTHGDVLALGISTRNPQTLWAAVAFTQIDRNLTSLYRSINGGATWSEARAGIPPGLDIRAITVNTPSDPGLAEAVYVAGAGTAANPGAVYRSTDGGTTWVSISIGLPADSALAITTDPRDRRRVLAGTNLGVWELTQLPDSDGDGAPDALENFAPNGGDGNGDGQSDALQGDVGSTIVLLRRAAKGFGGCDGYFTTAIVNNAECPQARDVQQVDMASLPVDLVPGGNGRAFRQPLQGLSFEIPQCQRATMEITFHLAGSQPALCPSFDDFQWSFRFYGPQVPGDASTFGWYDLGARATRDGNKTWRLTLDAGQFGSYRPNDPANPANNAILFVGAPALSGDRVFGNGFEPAGN